MLICGQVNPPPPSDPNYNGAYLNEKDIKEKAANLKNLPLWIEHDKKTEVGRILQGWVDPQAGSMWALAEIDVSNIEGAMAAAAIKHNKLQDFSIGWTVDLEEDKNGHVKISQKVIHEVSLVKEGAQDNCHIYHRECPGKSLMQYKQSL